MKRNIMFGWIIIAMCSGCVLEEVKDCPAPNGFCGGECINLASNKNHCGECKQSCDDKPEENTVAIGCLESHCQYECMTGYQNAGTAEEPLCLDVTSDRNNCGAIGKKCQEHVPLHATVVEENACINGKCQYECMTGYQNTGTTDNPLCLDISSDSKNCGAVGNICEDGEVCVHGRCEANSCGDGLTLCSTPEGNLCMDIHGSDMNNCGKCDKKCTENVPPNAQLKIENVCIHGQCQYECMTGYQNAGTAENPLCLDISSDSKNCGAVGNICENGEVCVNRQCVTNRCSGTQTLCSTPEGNQCLDVNGSDINNCGACGYRCESKPFAQGTGCREGKCEYECYADYGNIGTTTQPICVSLKESVENCGRVGNNCKKMPNADITFCYEGTCMAYSCVCGMSSGGKCMEQCNYDCTKKVWTGISTDGGGCANGYATMEMTDHSANLKEAAQDCAKRGMRLPTCNELASVSRSQLKESMSRANYWCANYNFGEGHGDGLGHNCHMPDGECGSHDVTKIQKYRCVRETADMDNDCRCE